MLIQIDEGFLIYVKTLAGLTFGGRVSKATYLFVMIAFYFLPLMPWCADALGAGSERPIKGSITRFDDATHIEFTGRSEWDYDLTLDPHLAALRLRIPQPDADSLKIFEAWKDDPLIKKIKLNPQSVDGQAEITLVLRDEKVEWFDYLTDQPSRLIVDIYQRPDKSSLVDKGTNKIHLAGPDKPDKADNADKAEKGTQTTKTDKTDKGDKGDKGDKVLNTAASPPPKSDPTKDPTQELAKNTPSGNDRLPAASEFIAVDDKAQGANPFEFETSIGSRRGIFDGGDPEFTRFKIPDAEIREEAIIASRQNIYIEFPMLKLESPHLKSLWDHPVKYEIAEKKSKENKEARLILHLFNHNRIGVLLEALKRFRKKYPESRYRELLKYLEADSYYAQWRTKHDPVDFEIAMSMYRGLVEQFPKSILTERTQLLIGYSYLYKGDFLSTIKTFQKFARTQPNSKHVYQTQVAIGEALGSLHKYEDAISTYGSVEASAERNSDKTEAAYRRGDVYFEAREFARAVQEYERALKLYPVESGNYPNAFYNVGESQFWLGRYKEALDAHREFLRRFPLSKHGGYAMDRLGELLEILGANDNRVMGALFETYFRYRNTPGADIARVRILSKRMKVMKSMELEQALQEVTAIADRSRLPKMGEFIALMVADGYYDRKEFLNGINYLAKFYQENPTISGVEVLQTRMMRLLTADIRGNVEKGDFIEALRLYSKMANTWKGRDRIDIQYYVGVAYEKAGVYSEATTIYREVLNQLYSIRGTEKEKERSVFEVLPTSDALNLRLARLALIQKDLVTAFQHIDEIKSKDQLSEPDRIELAEVLAQLEEESGNRGRAIKYYQELLDAWKGKPYLVSNVHVNLAQLQIQEKKFSEAEANLEKVFHWSKDSKISVEVVKKAMKLKAELLTAQGKPSQAAELIGEYLEKYARGDADEKSLRYTMGNLYYQNGKIMEAEKAWSGLRKDKSNLWSKLASERMNEADWKNQYKKYIDRIPAMEAQKGK